MKKKIIIRCISILSIIILVVCSALYIYQKKEIEIVNNKIEKINIKKTDDITNEDIINKLISNYNNEDIIGTLKISNLFYIPLVKTSNNDFYLNHSLNKNYDEIGTPFLDYRHSINDRQINIYGHNSKIYNLPFRKLEGYLSKEFYNDNKEIVIESLEKTNIYLIFAVDIIEKSNYAEHLNFLYIDDDMWLQHLTNLKELSIYDTNIEITKDDNIIILQTCLYDEYENNFLVIAGKQVN